MHATGHLRLRPLLVALALSLLLPFTVQAAFNQDAKLTASDGADSDQFGVDVDIDVEGAPPSAIVGAYLDDNSGGSNAGAAYVFTESGGTWSQQTKLTASDAAAQDRLGWAVALDGDTAIVGAFGESSLQGAAYVFTRSGSTWTQQQKLTASDGTGGDEFGYSVDIDGDSVVVGAIFESSEVGAAYVFTRSGTTWTEQQKLTASDGEIDDEFGIDVAIDGDTVVVGAYHDDDGGADAGAAYVFTRSGTTWTQQAKLTASDAAGNDRLGWNVDVSGDDAIAGAIGDESSTGAAYVFTRSGSTWSQQAKLTASDGATSDAFGYGVGIDGDIALSSAIFDDHSSLTNAGAAYVFTRSGSTWSQHDKLTASDAADSDQLGHEAKLDESTVIAGANVDDTNPPDAGSAYVFSDPTLLLVQLEDFTATRLGRAVRLEWATLSEIKHAGFRVLREAPDGTLEPVTDSLVRPNRPGGALSGAEYRLVDWDAPRGEVRYWLEDVDTRGGTTRHGPATAHATSWIPIQLPPAPGAEVE